MTGSVRVDSRAQTPTDFEAGDAGQHPVEYDEIEPAFRKADFGVVAARDDFDLIAIRVKVVLEQQRERVPVLDHKNARRGEIGPRLAA